MRFEQLQYLEAAVRTGSFRQAAAEFGLAQPTISTQVQRLEEDLGVVLLVRGAQGVRPTYAAERILVYAMDALRAHHMMRQEASAIGGLKEGRIRLAAVSAATQTILPNVVSRLQNENPNIHFQVTELGSGDVRSGVASGNFDAGVLTRFKNSTDDDLRYIDIAEGRLVLSVPENHPLATRSHITGKDLAGQRVIIISVKSLIKQAFDQLTEGVDVNPVFYTDNAETAQRMVRAGVGIVIAHSLHASTRSGDGAVLIPLRGDIAETRLSAVLRPDEQPTPATHTFLQLLREESAQIGTR